METSNNEVVYEYPPFLRVYKDGRAERLLETKVVPPSVKDSKTGVSSKDVLIVPETGVSARLYLPKIKNHNDTQPQQKKKKKKLPLLIYFHGGAFCVESAFSPLYHNYITSLVAKANVVVVSVDYRLVPDHYLPAAYEDSWAALQWVVSHHHSNANNGPESWLNNYADFNRVFLGGDSAGANISHNMAMRAGVAGKPSFELKILGIVLIHPSFWSSERPVRSEDTDMDKKEHMDKYWPIINPTSTGNDDPLINPMADPKLSNLGCNKVLVCIAEKDIFRDMGWLYYETLRNSRWGGAVEIMESKGKHHAFHLFNPSSEKAVDVMKRFVSFLNHEKVRCCL